MLFRILRHMLHNRHHNIKQSLPGWFVVLRKRHFSFLLLAAANCDSDDSGSRKSKSSSNTLAGNMAHVEDGVRYLNKLMLYYHQYSYYSQKVVLLLHEKNLPFDKTIINITRNKQYSDWYLDVNHRGEVPVLQDTGKIIPDSTRIIDYLEDNFSNGDTPSLLPMGKGLSDIRQKVTKFRRLIEPLPGNTITMGAIFHPELAPNPKIPFIAPVRNALKKAEINSSKNLRAVAEKNREYKGILLQKAEGQDKNFELIKNKEEILKVLDQVDEALSKVEEELKSHDGGREDWWLCTDKFTLADVVLTILLERLNQVGMESRFWTGGKRPHVEKYYARVQERDSYKKTFPSKLFFIKTLIFAQGPLMIGVSMATVVALIVGGVFLTKKLIV